MALLGKRCWALISPAPQVKAGVKPRNSSTLLHPSTQSVSAKPVEVRRLLRDQPRKIHKNHDESWSRGPRPRS
jgi:hypothetical protein